MKDIGLDVKLLKIGLQYAQLRATGGNFLQLFSSQDSVKLEVDPSNYQNLTYLHAMVILQSSTELIKNDHDIVLIWQYRLWSFQWRDTNLERFLAKNQL